MKFSTQLLSFRGFFLTGVGILLSGSFLAASVPSDLRYGLLPDAELVIYMDAQAMNDTGFFNALKSRFDSIPGMTGDDQIQDKLAELGIEAGNIISMTFSVANTMAAQTQPDAVRFAAAILTDAKVDKAQMETLLRSQSDELKSMKDMGSVNGFDTFQVTTSDPAPMNVMMGLRPVSQGSLLLIGSENVFSSQSAIRSLPSGLNNRQASANRVLGGQQGWISFVLSPELQGMLQQQVKGGGMSQMPGAESLEGLQEVIIGMAADDALQLNIGMRLKDNTQAQDLTNLLRFSVIGMVRMMVGQQFGGNPPPFFASLNAAQNEDIAVLQTRISTADLDFLKGFLPNNQD